MQNLYFCIFLGTTNKPDEALTEPKEPQSDQPGTVKAKEEWVTVIFGEDGKQITAEEAEKLRGEKSVYDMEDEDFNATKATPFAGN